MFVNMSVTLLRDAELDVIKEGIVIFVKIDFLEQTVKNGDEHKLASTSYNKSIY